MCFDVVESHSFCLRWFLRFCGVLLWIMYYHHLHHHHYRTQNLCGEGKTVHAQTSNGSSSYLNPPSTSSLSSTTAKLIPPNWIFYTIYIYFYLAVHVFAFARLHFSTQCQAHRTIAREKMVSVNFCCGFFLLLLLILVASSIHSTNEASTPKKIKHLTAFDTSLDPNRIIVNRRWRCCYMELQFGTTEPRMMLGARCSVLGVLYAAIGYEDWQWTLSFCSLAALHHFSIRTHTHTHTNQPEVKIHLLF